jgi:hypothetical protein
MRIVRMIFQQFFDIAPSPGPFPRLGAICGPKRSVSYLSINSRDFPFNPRKKAVGGKIIALYSRT